MADVGQPPGLEHSFKDSRYVGIDRGDDLVRHLSGDCPRHVLPNSRKHLQLGRAPREALPKYHVSETVKNRRASPLQSQGPEQVLQISYGCRPKSGPVGAAANDGRENLGNLLRASLLKEEFRNDQLVGTSAGASPRERSAAARAPLQNTRLKRRETRGAGRPGLICVLPMTQVTVQQDPTVGVGRFFRSLHARPHFAVRPLTSADRLALRPSASLANGELAPHRSNELRSHTPSPLGRPDPSR